MLTSLLPRLSHLVLRQILPCKMQLKVRLRQGRRKDSQELTLDAHRRLGLVPCLFARSLAFPAQHVQCY